MGYLVYVPIFLIVAISIILHEVAHGYAAYRMGDHTAQQAGRLTLNPIKHIDPFMTLLLPAMLLYMTGGRFAFGGAKPVPINPRAFANPRKGMMLTALAGPATNIALALLLTTLLIPLTAWTGQPLGNLRTASLLEETLIMGILLNLILATFNLMPIPPLDGSRVLAWLLPEPTAHQLDQMERYGILILLAFLFLPGYFGLPRPWTYIARGILTVVATLLDLVNLLVHGSA